MLELSPNTSDLAICTKNNSSIKIKKKVLGIDQKKKLHSIPRTKINLKYYILLACIQDGSHQFLLSVC